MPDDDESEAAAEHGAVRLLAGGAAQRDIEAWEDLYRRNYARLFTYARRRLASDAASDDAVSDTMLRALDRIENFTWQGGGIDAWIYGILRNVIHEAHRRERRSRPMATLPDQVLADADPVAAVVEGDRRAELRAAFARLSSEDRQLLHLRVVVRLSADGVASATGTTAGAVRTAQSRALHRLRTHYEAVARCQ